MALAGGGGFGVIGQAMVPLQWELFPSQLAQDSLFVACGLRDAHSVTATLTTPDRLTHTVEGGFSDSSHSLKLNGDTLGPTTSICWGYYLPFSYGMMLGRYQLDLSVPNGQLIYSWYIGYSFCPLWFNLITTAKHRYGMFMDLLPNSIFLLNFYNFEGTVPMFVASRQIKSDANGAVAVDIRQSASSPFGFNVDSSSWQDNMDFSLTGENGTTVPGLESQVTVGNVLCSLEGFHDAVKVTPQINDTLIRYQSFEGTKQLDQIPAGDPLEIEETRVSTSSGMPIWWYRTLSENGEEGWSSGSNIAPLETQFVAGGHAEVIPTTNSDAGVLYSLPDKSSTHLGTLPVGTQLRTVEQRPQSNITLPDNTWYHVQTSSGLDGWLTADEAKLLPWVSDTPIHPRSPFPMPVATIKCTNSLPTRLEVGNMAYVLPGAPNNLRNSPDGDVIRQLNVGTTFSILDGPECSAKGHTFYEIKTTTGDWIGWTAESVDGTYFLAPQ